MNSEDEHENTSDLQPDLEASNNEAVQRLLSLLDLSDGFTIAFVECNFWQDGVALVAALSEQIENDPEWEDLQILDWEFTEEKLRLLQQLHGRLEVLPNRKGKKLALVLRGLENAIAVVGDYPQFLVDINFVRDGYIKMVPHPVVFVLPDYAITRFAKYAPDFWAWKSGLFKFKTAQETRDFAVAKTIGSDRILGNYLKPEKQERIDLLHRLLMEANPSGSDPESNRNAATQMNILNELGLAYDSLSEFNRAIEFFQQALEISRKIGDRNGEAKSLMGRGNAYFSLGQYQQAVYFYEQSLTICTEIGDRNGEANSFMGRGNAYFSLGQNQQAIYFYEQALKIYTEIGDRNGEAKSLNGLGSSSYLLGQNQQAIYFYEQSLKIYTEIGDHLGKAYSLGNLGNSSYSLGQCQQAIHFYQQSLEISREIGDRHGEAYSFGNLGSAYGSLGQYQQAVHFYRQFLEICKEIGDRHGEAGSLNNLGLALKKMGRRSESIEAFNASRKIFEELGLYHEIEGSDKVFAPLETVAKEPKRFIIKEEPKEPDWYQKSLPNYKPIARKRTQHKNLFQQIINWFRRLWSQLWRKY